MKTNVMLTPIATLDANIASLSDGNGNTRTRSGQVTLVDGATRQLAEYRFARDNAETKFLDWRDVPADIAVLPELTFTYRDVLCRVSSNDSAGRRAA